MAGLLFDFAHMEEQRRTVQAVFDSLARHMDELDGMVSQVAESWSGEAHAAFRVTYDQWRQAAANVHQDIGYLHQIIFTSQGNFASADQAVHVLWGGAA